MAQHTHPDRDVHELLAQVVQPDGRFGHRQHVHLAWLAVQRYGAAEAADLVCSWIRRIARYENAPQKYNETMTRAWVQTVAHHAGNAAESTFEGFAECNPELFDKRLLARHYSPAVLASNAARSGWVEPDREPFPWTA